MLGALLLLVGLGSVSTASGTGARAVSLLQTGIVFYPDDPIRIDPDTADSPEPEEFEASQYYDVLENLFLEPGDPVSRRALNVNTLGEVPDSSWFTNRHGRERMSVEELVRGPDTLDGPAAGTWTVVGRQGAGITPKFNIRDARGDVYVIKFDPMSNPEMASAAEAISTKLFHALGYHVPENYVVRFDPDRLEIDPEATFRDDTGVRQRITEEVVDRWVQGVPREPDGSIRALASKFLAGTPIGPFFFFGTRSDDANDIFPHEHRRELRGLQVFSAWLNHDDSRSVNTLDMYVEDQGRRYVRHYLIDFGSTLGSASTFAQKRRAGNEYFFEGDKFFKGIYTFGFWVRPWVTVEYPDYPSIGRFESDFFTPENWKPEYPNAAFERLDAADAFWAARSVAAFTDEDLGAIVAAGELSDPEAEAYLVETLIKRRDKVVAFWLAQTNPLDNFGISGSGSSARLVWENAAVARGLSGAGSGYEARWFTLDNMSGERAPVGSEVGAQDAALSIPAEAWGAPDAWGLRYAVVEISTIHPSRPHWAEPVVVSLRNADGRIEVVGIERPRGGGAAE